MIHFARTYFGNFRWHALGIASVLILLMAFSYFVPVAPVRAIPVREADTYDNMSMSEGSNAVTAAAAVAESYALRGSDIAKRNFVHGSRNTANTLSHSGQEIRRGLTWGAATAGSGILNSTAFVARTTIETTAFVIHAPGTVLGLASETAIVNAVIKPVDTASLPIIDASISSQHMATKTTLKPIETVSNVTSKQGSAAVWPIHGEITTLFGVPHWPYQPTHTGIDISDGRPSGVTPIRPFRPGVVTEVVKSYRGLGNYVSVDHGEGVKSVYAHLSSITVQAGQTLSTDTTLGFEGSTGASTGTHLHFEIWVNGQVQNPLLYINSPL